MAYAISALGFGICVPSVQACTFESIVFVTYVCLLNALLAVQASRSSMREQATSNAWP
jgi:hypothetical protein